jgi:hypothetical protein
MFSWLKSKAKKRLSIEADKAIFQIEKFISFAFSNIEEGEYDNAFKLEVQDQLMSFTLLLTTKIEPNRKNDGTFPINDADKLMELNKNCRRIYSRFNLTKSFDEEFKYFVEEKEKPLSRTDLENELRKGTKLEDLEVLTNVQTRNEESLKQNLNQKKHEKTINLDQGSFLGKKNFTKEAYIEQWKKWTDDIKMLCTTSEDFEKLKDLEIWVDELASKSFDNMYQEEENKLNK